MTVYLLYSAVGSNKLAKKLGHAEYSYFFVREKFRKMLERHATVIVVSEPEREVDAIYDAVRAEGRDCVFLSFCAPHSMPRDIRCPTVPVFAWEFDTIPDEVWDDDARNDWRAVLSSVGQAITHSQYGAQAVASAMGTQFPVASIPAPVWDNYRPGDGAPAKRMANETAELELDGAIVDSRRPSTFAEFSAAARRPGAFHRLKVTARYAVDWYREVVRDLLPAAIRKSFMQLGAALRYAVARRRRTHSSRSRESLGVELDGQIFLSVFNPLDGRKNWQDMLTAFCSSLRDCPDATLILKFVHVDSSLAMEDVRSMLRRLPPFQCRVIAIDEFLDKDRYRQLLAAATFAVNSSLAEGQCLPLMEAMSGGTPVITPNHTGMSDYIDADVGFVVRSSPELCCWPHDTRWVYRARRYRIDWQSLVEAYRDAYRLAKEHPERYRRMSEAAAARMQSYCSEQTVYERLQRFLQQALALPRPAPELVNASDRPLAAAARATIDQDRDTVFASKGLDLGNAELAG
jgi:glycosyltransferase involved in cell wall biosynthesis